MSSYSTKHKRSGTPPTLEDVRSYDHSELLDFLQEYYGLKEEIFSDDLRTNSLMDGQLFIEMHVNKDIPVSRIFASPS